MSKLGADKVSGFDAIRKLSRDMGLIFRLPERLEKIVMDSIVEHRIDNEDAAMTFGRIIQLAELEMNTRKWHEIDTAPKDGTAILLAGGSWGDDIREQHKCVMTGWWEVIGDRAPFWNTCCAEGGQSLFPYNNPTHWKPVPTFNK